MHFSPFGILYLLAVLVLLIYSVRKEGSLDTVFEPLFVATIVTSVFLDVGYVCKFASFEFVYSKLSAIFYIILFFLDTLVKRELFSFFKRKKKLLMLYGSLLLIIVLGYLVAFYLFPGAVKILPTKVSLDQAFNNNELLAFPAPGYFVLKAFAMFNLWAVFAIVASDMFKSKKSMRSLLTAIFYGFIGLFFVQLVELVLNYAAGDFLGRKLINIVFGEGDSTVSEIHFRFGLKNAYSLFKEPSHLGATLVIAFSLFYVRNLKVQQKLIIPLICYSFLAGIISGSTTSIIVLAFGSVLIAITLLRNKKFSLLALLCGGIALLFVVGYLLELSFIHEALEKLLSSLNKGKSHAGQARHFGVLLCYKAVAKYPLFGVGLGVTKSSGLLATMAANIGLLGISFYFYFLYKVMDIQISLSSLPILFLLFFMLNFAYPYGTFYSPLIMAIFLPLNKSLQETS